MRSRQRVIKLILLVLSRPNKLTRRDLAEKLEVSKKTIDEDVAEIRKAGLDFQQNTSNHKCSIIPDSKFKELEYLMPLTSQEQFSISTAIDKYCGGSEKAKRLKNKFYSLYDFQSLGIQALRRPEIEKLDLLEAAKNKEHRVILENYRSNSNEVRNRTVEPFDIDSEHGMLQAYDVDDQETKHFKLNRIERVHPSEKPWEFKREHNYKYTDVFRIADNNRVPVQLQLDVYAYNALVESFPKSRADILPGAKVNTYNFQSKINANFLGLTNFIMGNRGHVKILSPEILKEHILKEAQKIIDHIKNQD